jgi:hypothetical protein
VTRGPFRWDGKRDVPPVRLGPLELRTTDRRDDLQSEETWMEPHVLRCHGWSIAALAREFGLNWRTARAYATADEAPRYRPRARLAELSAAQVAHVERRLAACPDLRATVLLRELTTEYGYTGSYASLRRRVVLLRPAVTGEPVLRFETGPGIQTQGDWADVGAWPLGEGTADLFAFVAILGCSHDVATAHSRAHHSMAGVWRTPLEPTTCAPSALGVGPKGRDECPSGASRQAASVSRQSDDSAEPVQPGQVEVQTPDDDRPLGLPANLEGASPSRRPVRRRGA